MLTLHLETVLKVIKSLLSHLTNRKFNFYFRKFENLNFSLKKEFKRKG